MRDEWEPAWTLLAIMPLVTWRGQKKQGYSKEHRVEFVGSRLHGLLPPFLYELQPLVTNFANEAERDL